MKITNQSKALQGVRTVKGLVYVKPGETRDVEMDEGQATRVRALPFFAVRGNAPKDGISDQDAPADDIAELRAEYERVIGKRPFPGWKADALREKIAEAGA